MIGLGRPIAERSPLPLNAAGSKHHTEREDDGSKE